MGMMKVMMVVMMMVTMVTMMPTYRIAVTVEQNGINLAQPQAQDFNK